MYPTTATALTTAIVWSDMTDAMLVSAHADSNCTSGLKKKQTLLASGHNGNNKTFGLLVDKTENSMGGQRLKGYQWVNCVLF